MPEAQRRRRRPLVGVVETAGRGTRARGDPRVAALLRAALERGSEPETRSLTHGFHAYPARMHPAIARHLVATTPADAIILDPFAGSGTVLVEAAAHGRRAIGVDANPLAVRLARLKTSRWSHGDLERLIAHARALARRASGRAAAQRGTRLPGFDPRTFAPHVFRELHFLRAEIERGPDPAIREALWLVLSAIAVKVSLRVADTSELEAPKRLAAGFVSRHFARKAEELARGLGDLARAIPEGTPGPEVIEGDARDLPLPPRARIGRVITSPPYPGIYDYVAHHALRIELLGIDARRFSEVEIGARRRSQASGALETWRNDLGRVARSLERHLEPGGLAIFLIGDGIAGGQRVRGDESLTNACSGTGLEVRAVAWQSRPSRSRLERAVHGPTKNEYLIALSARARPSGGST
ncbi:MAG: hypothetical protein HYY06_29475 [Deltaproteobacteria bacterium]|nr:hypothetical protein [Deltaproteobacteria bacterium]